MTLEEQKEAATKKLTKVDFIDIHYDDSSLDKPLVYSQLAGVTAINENNRDIFYILITHTSLIQDSRIRQILDTLNTQLQEKLSEENKIEIIKKIVWHLSHAMLCARGSAAIMEIILSGLCKANNIDYEEWSLSTPPDLIAIFSPTPEEFSRHFSLTPRKDMIKAVDTLIDQGIQSEIAKKLKAALEGQLITFNNEEQKAFNDRSSNLGQLVEFYRRKGILVEKILGFKLDKPLMKTTKSRMPAEKPKQATSLTLDSLNESHVRNKPATSKIPKRNMLFASMNPSSRKEKVTQGEHHKKRDLGAKNK